MADKIYCGIGKERKATTRTGEEFTTLGIAFSPEHLETLNNYAKENNGWASINISKRQAPSDKGVTHTVTLNTFKPTKQGQTTAPTASDADSFNDQANETQCPF